MTRKQSFKNRITSVFLTIAILFSMIPLTARAVSAVSLETNRIADPSTIDGWKQFFHTTGDISTENAGGVWMDKSVFTDASAFAGFGITQEEQDSFLVALSAIAANMNITGMSSVPTDTMLVLDLSGSMNGDDGNNDVVRDLISAANESIKNLLSANKHNRVGVVLYSGPYTVGGSTTENDAILMLPLGRYTTDNNGEYLSYDSRYGNNPNGNGNRNFEVVKLNSAVRYENSTQAPASNQKDAYGGTYIQKGVILAMNQFTSTANSATIEDPVLGTLNRKPVLVLMSDGAPTVGSTNFTSPGTIQLGNGSATSAALGFVSQLSAAYAKAKIEEKYGTDALFYTLGLGINDDNIALSVLDPDNSKASTAVDDFWNDIQIDRRGNVTFAGYNHIEVDETVSLGNNRSVTKIRTPLEQNYVDQYFSANTSNMIDVFKNIVSTIQLQSAYFPTLIYQNEDLSGYISFVDKIGEYMGITDIKGILIDDHLFSGADLASNFVAGGGKLGTYDNPTALGIEMVAAVRARLGIDSDDIARTLISLAYENGQLSYTNANNYSNYIGWYANAAGKFLGFYNEGTTILPAATGNKETDPAFVIRSYGYLGAVDESHGVTESDMMYATVQVRKNIATGEELVTFAVPAALIPIISYNVTLDENGALSELTVSGADNPIRLVYEVALDDNINSFNIKEVVSAEYLAENTNTDGTINFYTNQWEHKNTTGYGTVNTYSYFNPSRQNDRYYYLEDAPVYSNANGTLYTGEAQPDAEGTFYRSYVVYKNNGSLRAETIYRSLSDAAKATALRKDDGSWYIPKGNVHVNLDGYTVDKTENLTGTLGQVHLPFVDTHNHTVNDEGYNFYVGATLGNNGKMTVFPETGIKLTKTMAEGVADPGEEFIFDIFNMTNSVDSNIYTAWLIKADGTEAETKVIFNDGNASVGLNAGDVLYIGDMTAGDTFRIVERETVKYVATATGLSDSGSVTVNQYEIKNVSFVNDDRGTGNLTIAKEVEHDFGQEYQIPADKTFTMQVKLSGIGTANATFIAEHSGDSTVTTITTDADGKFTVTLKHDEQLEMFGLPAGTVATVVEQNPATGFTPVYWDNGVLGDGQVTITDSNTVSVIVVNDYAPTEVHPVNIELGGNKVVKDEKGDTVTDWIASYEFDIVLERYDTTNGWVEIGRRTVNDANKSFSFNEVMAAEKYTVPGVYSYQMYEEEPTVGTVDRVNGMIYDLTWHTFSVYVSDTDMDGKLEIVKVHSDHANKDFELVNGVYTIKADFENAQTVTVPALATVEIQKILNNASGSTHVSLAGYNFGLYTDVNCTTAAIPGNGVKTISLNPTDTVGEGRIDIQFDESGTYTFYVKEVATSINGMTYSDQVIKIVVTVSASATAGTLHADVAYYTADGAAYELGTDGEVEFTNVYDPKDAELIIDFVSKEISGRDLANGEFKFEVQTQNGTKILEGTNNAAGKVTFDGTLKFDKVGTYYHNIVETSVDGNGVVTDKTTYRMTVSVIDVGGQLSASYVIVNATGNTITFKNTYTATPVENSIVGTKKLTGRGLLNDEFSFILTEQSYNGNAIQNPRSWTVKNLATHTDNIVFPAISYDKAGTYIYTVKEVVAEGGTTYGISYDVREYTVTVVIEDNGVGALTVKSESVSGAGTILQFENNYKANPTSAQFNGEKQLTGKVDNNLVGGEYEFELYNANSSWERYSLKETVTNAAGGLITFTKIDFDTAGDQYFIVVEKNGGQTIGGVTYDDTEYHVRVQITDDLKGQLHATIHIYNSEGIPQDKILFVNIYEITGGANVTLSGEKTIDGRDFKDDDSFFFELYETDEYYNIGGTPKTTVAMDSNTHKYEFTIDYTAADVGKTFYYVVKETGSGTKLNGLTYSSAAYQIKVEVRDNGFGGIETVTTVVNATTSTLDFVNEYEIEEGTAVQFEGTKNLENKDLGSLKFSFNLIESDVNWTVGNVLQSKQNNGNAFAFDKIEYMAAGDYYYLIAEADAGQTVNGITNDSAVYRIHVKVTDNLDGTLSKVVVMTKVVSETSTSTTAIVFTNVYTVTGFDSVALSGTKTLDGREWNENDEFVFELYEADENFVNLGETPVATATADPKIGFAINMTYGPDDMGETFYYVLKEKNAGKTINGISYSNTEYKVTVKVTDGGNGAVDATATVAGGAINALNFTNGYNSSSTVIDFEGSKTLNLISGNRVLKENDFTFDLYKANANFEIDSAAIMSVQNDENGSFAFVDVPLNAAGTHYFIIKENSQNPIGGVVYDNTQYHITVTVTDDGKGQLNVTETTMVKVKGEISETAYAIAFVNDYSVSSVNVTISGNKVLKGRELAESEFKFLMAEADEVFNIVEGTTPMTAFNNTNGSFSFDTLSFTEPGVYFFVVYEDDSVEVERVTFDGTVYYISIEVTDDENGKLVAGNPVIVKKGSDDAVDAIEFNNIYTPKSADITVDIDIIKTVVNKGSDKIGPEGFEFLLKALADGVEDITVKSDENGKAKFTLTFTEDDIGKTFSYKLTEVNCGKANVNYSTAEYAISITIALNEEANTLVATMTMNEAETAELVAAFENTYDYTPSISDIPPTGDNSNLAMWFSLMFICSGAVITLTVYDKKRRKTANN